MTWNEEMNFQLHVMELCENCKTAEDYEEMAERLHDAIESAIQELCLDTGIDDYEPLY